MMRSAYKKQKQHSCVSNAVGHRSNYFQARWLDLKMITVIFIMITVMLNIITVMLPPNPVYCIQWH